MEKCPKPVRRLTRYGYCYYYKLRSVFKLMHARICKPIKSKLGRPIRVRSQSTNFKIQFSNSTHGNISIAGPQSSLIFYGAYNKENF